MKKQLLSSIFALLISAIAITNLNAQTCTSTVAARSPNSGNPPGGRSFATKTAQSFTPTCSGKLVSITFTFDASSDDLRGSGDYLKCNIKDASGNLLGTGTWSNKGTRTNATETDNVFPTGTNTANFSCIYLTANTKYIWEIEDFSTPAPASQPIYLFSKSTTDVYTSGDAYADGTIVTGKDYQGWLVTVNSSLTAVAATQTQTNPTSSSSTDGSASVTPSGGDTSTYSYVWKKNGTTISGAIGSSISNQGIGTYTVEITNNGCTITKTFNLIVSSLGTSETQKLKSKIYPNPATTEITITLSENQKIEVYAFDGKLVKFIDGKKGENKIDVSVLVNGNYILKTKEGSEKFIKK